MSDYLDPNNEELLKDFFIEAQMQVDMLEQNILVLENEPDNHEAIDEIFRAAHTLKGGAATVQMLELSEFTHIVEDVLDEIRGNTVGINEEIINTLLLSIDIIKAMLELSKLEIDYKIARPESLSIIGSNSIHTSGDLSVVNINAISSQIWALDIVTMVATDLITNTFGGLDGITVDHNGNYYVSSYLTNEIYQFDSNFSNSGLAVAVPDGVADIHFGIGALGKVAGSKDTNSSVGTLAVPNLVNKVNFIPYDQLTQLTTNSGEITILNNFKLHQNFPNPFNPITSISYEIMGEALVNITVYDLLGAEVVQLVNEIQQPGIKTTNWNGKDSEGNMVNGGIYVYRLNTNNYSETKKMVLLK